MTTVSGVAVTRAGEEPATWAMGSLFEELLSSAQTGGAMGASVVTQPPGLATPLHVHTRDAEAWLVLDGTLTYRAGGQVLDLATGDAVWLPRDVPHAFRITGERPARCLVLVLPGGLMDLYDEVGRPAVERRLPDGGIAPGDVAAWLARAPEYGIRVVGPPLPEPAAG